MINIPNAANLDRVHPGTMAGIEVVLTAKNHGSFTERLRAEPDESLDAYVLLDAQDWMTDEDLRVLWTEITRTARPQARVIFRTAAEKSLLTGRVPGSILARWNYDEGYCRELTRRDRSSIYGGFHLYVLRG